MNNKQGKEMEKMNKEKKYRVSIMDIYKTEIDNMLNERKKITEIYEVILAKSSVHFGYHTLQKYIKRRGL